MNNEIWGPYFWFTLHTVTLGYPEKPTYIDSRKYAEFFISLQNVLPCPKCQEHYRQHLLEFPVAAHLNSKEALVKWCFNLHNRVNQSLNKPVFSYDEFREKYRKIYAPTIIEKVVNHDNIYKYQKYKMAGILVLLIIISGVIYHFYNKRCGKKMFFAPSRRKIFFPKA